MKLSNKMMSFTKAGRKGRWKWHNKWKYLQYLLMFVYLLLLILIYFFNSVFLSYVWRNFVVTYAIAFFPSNISGRKKNQNTNILKKNKKLLVFYSTPSQHMASNVLKDRRYLGKMRPPLNSDWYVSTC